MDLKAKIDFFSRYNQNSITKKKKKKVSIMQDDRPKTN